MGFPDYMALAWFLSNLITGLAYLWVSLEIHTWTLGLPDRGTGFRTLARLFEVFIVSCGVHHIVMASTVWDHPTTLYLAVTDMAVACVAFITAMALNNARTMIKKAFLSMLRHENEWADRQPHE